MNTNEVGIKKIAKIYDEAKDTYLEVIQFSTSDGDAKTIELPRSVIKTAKLDVERELLDADAELPKDKEEVKAWIDTVANSDAPERWVYAASTGWRPDESGFVLPAGFIGDPPTSFWA
jgi:hypothetical protein